MAGPGGGPPRKSHTKSRNGCRTCKRRHIRCDETFPQCRNCSKHNCRCDYMDLPAASEELMGGSRPPNLMMTAEIERQLDNWRMTGEPPFPELHFSSRTYWLRFSVVDLRLIHHIAGLSIDMHQRGYSAVTQWAQKMPTFLAIAISNEFVMSAILALSASHLAWKTNDTETDHLAYHHRGVALKGLHEAIGSFSQDNSEAILAASMLLSWQATEWRSWASLQQGVSTVLNAMRPWTHESKLASFLEAQRSIGRARTPVTPTFPASQIQPRGEDLARLERATSSLHELRIRLAHNGELVDRISQLLAFLQQLRQDFPLQAPEEAFERLQELRAWLFWLPAAMLRPHESDLGAMAVLAHFFAIALALEPLFPEIGGAYLGTMAVPPMEEIRHILLARRASHPQESGVQVALNLMEIPSQIVSEYRARQQYMAQQSEPYRGSPRSPYVVPNVQLASSPENPTAGLFTNSPLQRSGNLTVPGSPYFDSAIHNRRVSQYGDRSPVMRAQRPHVMSERSVSYPSRLSGHHADYAPESREDDGMTFGMDYHETSAFHTYGAGTGFVAPAQLWT